MTDLITIIILILVLGGVISYIIKSKKNGAKCIGCPSGGCCPSNSKSQCNCKKENN